jgi:HK97 family phage portal protein
MSLSRVSSAVSVWSGTVLESFVGSWQRNVTPDKSETLLGNSAVYACVTGIASDVAKLRIKLAKNENGIWTEITTGSPWLVVLRKPNHYQTRIKFLEQWVISKLLNGNAYILKQRESVRGVVNALYVLNPMRVIPLVAENGDVYYQINQDNLSQLPDQITVPASEIIHDMMVSLWHPLVGVPPLYACAMAGTLGNKILNDSAGFFANRSMPGGVLTAPGVIAQPTAERLKKDWEENFGGKNFGRGVAVLGDGLKFEVMRMTAEASQLAEQLKLTTEEIARAFHYPLFKLGGPLPPYAGNTEALIITYYTDCLQAQIESIELCLDEGLELPRGMGTELDLDNLMRMDTASLYKTNSDAVGGGWMAPDEARFRANLKPAKGGESPYLQQQNYSLAALAKRDSQADLWVKPTPPDTPPAPIDPPPAEPVPPPTPAKSLDEEEMRILYSAELRRECTQ